MGAVERMAVGARYSALLREIAQRAQQIGRDPREITLVAVTKGHSWQEAQEAYAQGCRDFGENRVQEWQPKEEEAPADVRWHLIGTLQKNKVNKVVGRVALIHSVDSSDLAEKISQAAEREGLVVPVLLQVNTSGEAQKHGLNPEGWRPFLKQIDSLSSIRLDGFMTMAPETADKALVRACFRELRIFRDEAQHILGRPLPHLSMGMSQDYLEAVEEGATLLRVGSALF